MQNREINILQNMVHNISLVNSNEEFYLQLANTIHKLSGGLRRNTPISLYPDSGNTVEWFSLKLVGWKTQYNIQRQAARDLVELMRTAFPFATIPSYYLCENAVRETVSGSVIVTDVCKRDCLLFVDQYRNAQSCPECGANRYDNNNKPVKVLIIL